VRASEPRDMRYCIVGAGAVGAYVGALLQRSGVDVAFISRGAQLDALRARGLTVVEPDGEFHLDVRAFEAGVAIEPADVVVLAVKAHQVLGAVPAVRALYGPHTTVVSLQNGIPWWYTHGHPIASDWELTTVDPKREIAHALDVDRAIGATVYFSANIAEPGVVHHDNGVRMLLGEPLAGTSARVEAIAATMRGAGFDASVSEHLRPEIWSKLLGNVNFNPISALAHAFVREIYEDAGAMALVRATMNETIAVARALGDAPPMTVDERLALTPLAGDVRTSMLQDAEAGRHMEIAPIVGAVVELGTLTGVETPVTRTLLSLVSLLDRTLARP
jgi:2-dehydropantoate 2-reductase